MFKKDDFGLLQSLPRYKREGDRKLADLPLSALVTVFFTMNAYSKTRPPPTPSTNYQSTGPRTPASSSGQGDDQVPSASSQTLSLNVQFVIYHGQADDSEDDPEAASE